MNISWKNTYLSKIKPRFLTPKQNNSTIRLTSFGSDKKHNLSRNTSNKTLIDNKSISHSFNSSILSMNLKPFSYKRAESELRQILRPPDSPQEATKLNKLNKLSSSLSRSTRPGKITRYSKKKTDSSLSPKEADLILEEHRSVRHTHVWKSILTNYKSNPKQLLDLIPISLSTKNSVPSPGNGKAKSRHYFKGLTRKTSSKIPTEGFVERIKTPILSNVGSPKLDPFETYKQHPVRITEDWERSLLHYNIRNNVMQSVMPRMSEEELRRLLKKLPSGSDDLVLTKEKCMDTLKSLLMELLGTKQDVLKFESAYKSPQPSTIRTLINNCLNLIQLRGETEKILKRVIDRELIIENLVGAEKKEIIRAYKLSKEIRSSIQQWLANEIVPFKQFIYRGSDYLLKMDKDLVVLQSALYKKQL